MEKSLAGEVTFVTGSGRGLGKAMAERLAELGASVGIHDISQEAPAEFGEAASLDAVAQEISRRGGKVQAVTGDIADETVVRSMVEQVERALGPITVLVNCAGGDIAAKGGKPQPNTALGIPMGDVRAIIDRNLIGTLLLCRAVCPGMVARNQGSVINIGSAAAHYGTSPEVVYSTIKAAIVHFTRCLAAELRPHGVRVNAVSPGPTMTARFLATRKIDPAMAQESVSLSRYGSPQEVADVVAFLASKASRFISGQVIRVDGGMSLFPG
ncbi:MAG TPA: SDR family oxidoreductase [Terriglobia bacterium]|nr:SDR family oxidoreductase [Terriglobia bacterium]